MAETPDELLRALADPERLAIAGASRSATAPPTSPPRPPACRRRGCTSTSTASRPAGVVRVNDDRHTYRLDAETLRWAAEQVGPPREAGLALGAATDDEEAVLGLSFPERASHRGPGEGVEAPHRARAHRAGVRAREHYEEKEVNAIVGRFFNDHASLRRYLVDEGFLDREGGVYEPGAGSTSDLR